MKLLYQFLFVVILALFLGQNSEVFSAEEYYVITGKIQDVNSYPIISSKISAYTSNNVFITGTLSDVNGKFTIDSLTQNKFSLTITAVGYSDTTFVVQVFQKEKYKDIGTIILSNNSYTSEEALVVAEKPILQITSEGKVMNVEDNPLVVGGSLIDVLQITPSISVDFDGNVSIRGSENIEILIDGQSVPSSASLRLSMLESIPASAVESIEIINNPNATYNPKGVGGVINIKLLKKHLPGLNGMVSVNIGTYDKYNSSVNLNYGLDNYNFFFSNDSRWDSRTRNSTSDFFNFMSNGKVFDGQISNGFRRYFNNNSKIGVEFFTKKTNFTTYLNYYTKNAISPEQMLDVRSFVYNSGRQPDTISTTNTYNTDDSKDENILIASSYSYNFDQEYSRLKIDFNYTEKKSSEFTSRTTLSPNTKDYFLRTNLKDKYQNSVLKANYTLPLIIENTKVSDVVKGKKTSKESSLLSKLDFGLYANIRRVNSQDVPEQFNNNLGKWLLYDSLSNKYNFDRQIFALYANYNTMISDFLIEMGLRAETANMQITQFQRNQTNIINYNSLFPNLSLKYKLNESNLIGFNYSRRIDRPSIKNLNPFLEIDNPQQIKYGNPAIQPEYINSLDVSYSLVKSGTSFITSVYHRNVIDAIRKYTFLDSNKVYNTTLSNFDGVNFVGAEFILDGKVAKWLNYTSTLNLYYNSIKAVAELNIEDKNSFSWNYKLNLNSKLFWGLNLQSFIYYTSPQITPQGDIEDFFNIDFAVKKEVFTNLLLSLRVTDLLNTYQYQNSISGLDFYNRTFKKKQTQGVFLNLSYKINQGLKIKDDSQSNENYDSEFDEKKD